MVKAQADWLEEKVAARLAACSPLEIEKALGGQVPLESVTCVLVDLDISLERDMQMFNQAIRLQADLKTLQAVDDAALARTIDQFTALQSGSIYASTQSAPQLAESHEHLVRRLLTPTPTQHRGLRRNPGENEVQQAMRPLEELSDLKQAMRPLEELSDLKPRITDEIRRSLAKKAENKSANTTAGPKNVTVDPASIVEERVGSLRSFSGAVIHITKDYVFIRVDGKQRQPLVVAATAKELRIQSLKDLKEGDRLTYPPALSKTMKRTPAR
jgi:hypothetical protein